MPKEVIFDKKNVIVTGGAGFIGSHLCDDLIKTSKVICVDNFISGDPANIEHLVQHPDFEFIKHNMIEPLDLEKFPELKKFKVEFQGIQEIYHGACPTTPLDFEKNMMEMVLTNSYGTKNILDVALKYKAKLLHFSSSVVYGPRFDDQTRFQEDYTGQVDFTGPRACYDEGKRFAETLVMTYRYKHNLNTKIARIFRTYGPRMKLRAGHMIPDFIINALDNVDLTVYGNKDFKSCQLYVSDVIDGLIKLMQNDHVELPINLSGQDDVSYHQIAEKIVEKTNSKSKG